MERIKALAATLERQPSSGVAGRCKKASSTVPLAVTQAMLPLASVPLSCGAAVWRAIPAELGRPQGASAGREQKLKPWSASSNHYMTPSGSTHFGHLVAQEPEALLGRQAELLEGIALLRVPATSTQPSTISTGKRAAPGLVVCCTAAKCSKEAQSPSMQVG